MVDEVYLDLWTNGLIDYWTDVPIEGRNPDWRGRIGRLLDCWTIGLLDL